MFVLLVVCLYGVVYGRLMDAKTWPLFGLYILRFIHFQKVFLYVVFFCFISAQSCEEIIYLFRVFGGKIQKQLPFL